ncbi:hypothetical protein, partial [Kribbella catacumbae]|uniref:hypothetical protein n=1 Tax=Kribbella catacumbae TaxID=460086 RepID=UPI00058B454B
PLTKGKGTFSFKAAGRGTTRYWRVAVPKMSYYGKPIVAEPVANWLGSGRLCTDRQEVVDRSAARHAHAGRGRPQNRHYFLSVGTQREPQTHFPTGSATAAGPSNSLCVEVCN